jgi:hypothetical protein
MTRHVDLAVSGGETLNRALRFHVAGPTVRLDALVAGDWIWYKAEPWPVYAVGSTSATAVRIRLGRGLFWEPDVTALADTLTLRATPATLDEVAVDYRNNAGAWAPLPYTIENGDTIRLLPHDDTTRAFTSGLSSQAEAPSGGPVSFEWQATATLVEVEGWRRIAEGALIVVPGQVAAPVPTPVVVAVR